MAKVEAKRGVIEWLRVKIGAVRELEDEWPNKILD